VLDGLPFQQTQPYSRRRLAEQEKYEIFFAASALAGGKHFLVSFWYFKKKPLVRRKDGKEKKN